MSKKAKMVEKPSETLMMFELTGGRERRLIVASEHLGRILETIRNINSEAMVTVYAINGETLSVRKGDIFFISTKMVVE